MVGPRAIDHVGAASLRRLLHSLGDPLIRVVLPDGRALGASAARAATRIHVRDRGALLRLLYDPDFQFGELYSAGRLEVEGDLVGLLCAAYRSPLGAGGLARWLPRPLIDWTLRNDVGAARDNAQHHYDVGNDFYQLWLDERMVYTCAYYPTPQSSLEEAQLAKLDHVCRKLALRPGEHVVEAGSGWGSLALHMARYYGVTVRAFNVSHEQVLYAREQAEKQGLQDRLEFVEDDYRNAAGPCDAFVSVGMLEHVGTAYYADLGRVIDRCLTPEGRGLIHTIGRSRPQPLQRWIRRRVFPNAHPPTLREMMDIFEPSDFAVLDVENLRQHYALTTRHWLERFESQRDRARELAGEQRARTWHLYLAGSVAAFETGMLHLFQVVFARAQSNRIPWSRGYVYTGGEERFGGTS
jgi:cyclopropane-fatty-acyl-phospholipid synthase